RGVGSPDGRIVAPDPCVWDAGYDGGRLLLLGIGDTRRGRAARQGHGADGNRERTEHTSHQPHGVDPKPDAVGALPLFWPVGSAPSDTSSPGLVLAQAGVQSTMKVVGGKMGGGVVTFGQTGPTSGEIAPPRRTPSRLKSGVCPRSCPRPRGPVRPDRGMPGYRRRRAWPPPLRRSSCARRRGRRQCRRTAASATA